MTDMFLDRIAELSGQSARVLDDVANGLSELGLDPYADTLRKVANEHKKIVYDCLVETQPIATRKVTLGNRLRHLAEVSKEIADEFVKRSFPGHEALRDAATQLEEVAIVADSVSDGD